MPRKKTAKFTCQQCGKKFAMAMHLGRHMTTMHKAAPMKSAAPTTTKESANVGAATQLVSLINKLHAERQEHVDAIAQIDTTFEQFGISSPAEKRRGRPRKAIRVAKPAKAAKKAKKSRGKARGTFATTGNESILGFVKAAGKKGVEGAEIAKHWKKEGRGTGFYVAVGKLVREKKLKREKVEGGRGSRYTAV